jgi:adenylyltransferase/sulfurtransferase
VNLSSRRYWVEEKQKLFEEYLGGTGVAIQLLKENCTKGADPYGPQNPIVFAVGPLNGVFPIASKTVAMFKSPLTGNLGESHAGGRSAVSIRMAGYGAIVIQGSSDIPVYLVVQEDEVKFRDASVLWGMGNSYSVGRVIREREPGAGIRTIMRIGRAGERLIPYASVITETYRHFGRLGLGAVFGSKKLKAILVSGNRTINVSDSREYRSIYNDIFTSQNAMHIAEPYNLIVDGSDNFPTRYLTNDLCVLTGKPNVYGSVYRFEGQVSVFDARLGPCYRCLFPDPPPPGLVPSCAESGVLGILPGTIGTLQATEALKLILGTGEPLIGRLLLYNAQDMSFEFVRLHKNPACKVCGEQPSVTELIDYDAFCGVPGREVETGSAGVEWDLTPIQLDEKLKSGGSMRLVDVREPHELEISHIAGVRNIPLGQLAMRTHELDPQDEIVLICKAGVRSTRALHILLGAGFHKLHNLKGGMNAWAREVDPRQPIY